ncbi:MAG: nucleotidyltransferase substrate binding protein [Methylococcales bacterium]|nr:nucleotidyltransferase substrate binding protein [Methylococcales bacterium]
MGNQALIYKEKFEKNLKEAAIHLQRINEAFEELSINYSFPIETEDFLKILVNRNELAFADQIIYRFSKTQDSMGAKLFKSFVQYQGENINRPFLDILNSLEKLDILDVEKWFELREIRNEIAHDYEENELLAKTILNNIYRYKEELNTILNMLEQQINNT